MVVLGAQATVFREYLDRAIAQELFVLAKHVDDIFEGAKSSVMISCLIASFI
jgi:hypothetical protein